MNKKFLFKFLTIFLFVFTIFSTTESFAQILDRNVLISYSLKDGLGNGYFLRIYKKGDVVRTLVIDTTQSIVYDAYKNLKNGETCWVNHKEQTKLILENVNIPVDSIDWKVKDMGEEIVDDIHYNKLRKKNQNATITFVYLPDQSDFKQLVDHLFLPAFNPLLRYLNAFEGLLTTAVIRDYDLNEGLKIKMQEFSFSNVVDSIFDTTKYNNYAELKVKPLNVDSGMTAFQGHFYKEKLTPIPYNDGLEYWAKEDYENARINAATIVTKATPPLISTTNGAITTTNTFNQQEQQFAAINKEHQAYIKYVEVQNRNRSDKAMNALSFNTNRIVYSPAILLSETIEAFYSGNEIFKKRLYTALKLQ
ncbi:hypothetical protein [Solitalea longa]|uniref:hypothetical protein n=1 Tax=Solitalea longa TaxID=2079460 RepID=UPI00105711BA|nr:hypothetical protein [Solitalea longa]